MCLAEIFQNRILLVKIYYSLTWSVGSSLNVGLFKDVKSHQRWDLSRLSKMRTYHSEWLWTFEKGKF